MWICRALLYTIAYWQWQEENQPHDAAFWDSLQKERILGEEMQSEWKQLWNQLNPPQGNGLVIFCELAGRYSELHRHHHALSHIQDGIREFRKIEHLCANKLGVELAIWFHDAKYNVYSKRNEDMSAAWFLKIAKDIGLGAEVTAVALKCILATKREEETDDADCGVMIDVDLSILGQSWNVYEKYMQDIRKEYRRVPLMIFQAKRKRTLKRFLDREHIYNTAIMREQYEMQARQNIARELVML